MSLFNVTLDPHAYRNLKKIKDKNPSIINALISAIDSLSSKPFSGKALRGSKKGCYSLRVLTYRIIYEIYTPLKTVNIIKIGHRKDVYR